MKTRRFVLPNKLIVKGDHLNPRNTKILDAETGDQVELPVTALQFTVVAGEANRLHVELCDIAIEADAEDVFYEMPESGLRTLAAMNGFIVQRAPSYCAKVEPYGPTDVKFVFRDLPGLHVVVPTSMTDRQRRAEVGRLLAAWIDQFEQVPAPTEGNPETDVVIYAIP